MDLSLIRTGLATLLQKNTMAAMDGIFSQVRGGGGGGVLGYRKGGGEGEGGGVGGREGLPYILKVFVCVYLSQLLLGVSSHSGCVVCLVWVGEVGLLSFLS